MERGIHAARSLNCGSGSPVATVALPASPRFRSEAAQAGSRKFPHRCRRGGLLLPVCKEFQDLFG